MRVFLTGASGFIGSRILPELLAHGHDVIGMTRSDAGAKLVAAAGATPFLASLEDPASVAAGAEEADAVIHTAFDHDFTKFAQNCEKDRRAILALGAALKGSHRPLMVTSGTGMGDPGDGGPATEAHFNAQNPNPRVLSELAVEQLLDDGVNVRVMRLPQVHDTTRQGLVSPYIQISVQTGSVAYTGPGLNRWPAAHVQDVAALFACAFDKGDPGTRYHAVAEDGITIRQIAETLGAKLKLPAVSIPMEQLETHLGWLAPFAGLDMPASSEWTRAQLNWNPNGPDLITDLHNLDIT
ncbi:SDR family oxidoreductase [uncultured Roseibium sp.]|uniref:SDR family oxidoreductase n=1 Tax=uncultured Roseibium sp. TaxID=1936171 RepID=UPI0026198573|nr:SDR family oxidoreductase [uncultured Roseibium sp.]